MNKSKSKQPSSTSRLNRPPSTPTSTSTSKPRNPNPTPTPARPSSSSSSASGAPNNPSNPQFPNNNPQTPNRPLPPQPPPQLGPPHPHPSRFAAILASIRAQLPPPPHYGLETLDRRTIALSDGTLRHYFTLPPPEIWDPPRLPPPQQAISPPRPPPVIPHHYNHRWAQAQAQAQRDENGIPAKRKREDELLTSSENKGGSGSKRKGKVGEDVVVLVNGKKEKKEVPVSAPVSEAEVRKAFLKMAKVIYENGAQRRIYMSNGKVEALKCIVCGK